MGFWPYLEYVKESRASHVLMVDASDVWFNSDPFDYFRKREDRNSTLFMSHDLGLFKKDSWGVPGCYGSSANKWSGMKQMYNAGVWGGKRQTVRCVLQCIVSQLSQLSKNRP